MISDTENEMSLI